MAVDGRMEYSLIEFSSKELDIVHVSKLRGYRVDAEKPFECICEWKMKGKSKSRSYKVTVLHDASTHFFLFVMLHRRGRGQVGLIITDGTSGI